MLQPGTLLTFVVKVMKAAELANIDDICVAQQPGPLWNVVLKAWYQKNTDAFCNNNPDRISQNASLRQQTFSLGSDLQSFNRKI